MKKFKPGVSFSDFVVADSANKRSLIKEETPTDYRRGWLVWLTVVVVFGGLIVRLAQLQLFYGERYRVLSEENRIQKIKLPAPRGRILDRNGVVLADNNKVTITDPVTKLAVDGWERTYPLGEAAAHVVGYVGRVKEDEVGLLKSSGGKYDPQDFVGRTGLEAQYEDTLRGIDGGRLVEVDNLGRVVRELGRSELTAGTDIKTGLDSELQKVALAALAGKKGAVVAADPRTGEIMALVSSPSFDPNWFVQGREEVSQVLADSNLPMFDRAIEGGFAPGSTFKMVTTTAAITSGKVSPEYTYQDEGVIRIAGYSYSNWLFSKNGGVEGVVGFVRAITRSTDTFFYKIGELTGPEIIAQWAKKVGFGKTLGIDVPGEVAGLMPDPDWKIKTKGEKWFLGNTYQMAIGQSDILATPLQVNSATVVWANGGRKCQPFIVGSKVKCEEVGVAEAALKIIKEGMTAACSRGGTAFPLFDFVPAAACKTGTAEYYDGAEQKLKTHAWLTAYAPAEEPTIAVTALVEGGGGGSNVAAPIVRKMLAKYFGVVDNYDYKAIENISE